MTVPVEIPTIRYIYIAPAVLSFNYNVFLETDLEVRFIDVDNSVKILTLNVDYTVALNPVLNGGTVNVTYVPPGGYGPPDVYLEIKRHLPLSQVTDWVNGSPFNMDILEQDLDRAVMLIQELYADLDAIYETSAWRGAWATGLYYGTRDLITGPDSNYYMVAVAHTSGVWANDLAAGKWILFIDVSVLVAIQTASEAAKTAAEAAATASAASAAASAADVVSTNADVVSTNADVVSTAADAVSTAADAAQTALDRIATAADVVLTNADVVSTAADVVLANKWAEEAEDVPVVAGKFSALHWAAKAAGFVKDFITGTDTPGSYVGAALQILRVNAAETAVEFAASTSELGANVISKAVDYSILPADLVGYDSLIVLVDASLATRNIMYPAPADYLGKTILVIADVDPAGNSVITKLSGGTEHHTSYAKGDFIKGTSDGVNDNILDEKVTAYGKITKTANETILAATTTNVFDTDISVEKNIGGLFDAVTNFRINPGFAQRIKVSYGVVSQYSKIKAKPNITGSYPFIVGGSSGSDIVTDTFKFDLLATDYLRPDVLNLDAGIDYILNGAVAKDKTFFEWRILERLR